MRSHFSGACPKGLEHKGTLTIDEMRRLSFARREAWSADFFFPPHGGRAPSDEAVRAATQRYVDKEKNRKT